VAVVFGTEKYGISDEVKDASDVFLRIPMVGFVESFNLSASAAIVFHVLSSVFAPKGCPGD
jgi:tRNA (guanosine-2'-O-)-methyltransferase